MRKLWMPVILLSAQILGKGSNTETTLAVKIPYRQRIRNPDPREAPVFQYSLCPLQGGAAAKRFHICGEASGWTILQLPGPGDYEYEVQAESHTDRQYQPALQHYRVRIYVNAQRQEILTIQDLASGCKKAALEFEAEKLPDPFRLPATADRRPR